MKLHARVGLVLGEVFLMHYAVKLLSSVEMNKTFGRGLTMNGLHLFNTEDA